MKRRKGPWSSPAARKQIAQFNPLMAVLSGEVTIGASTAPLGVANYSGRIQDVWLSVLASGKDDTNALSAALDVKKNGATVLTTSAAIAHVSGEASQQKTTQKTGDTGITQAVVNVAANDFVAGDVFTYDLVVTRTASPTTEIECAVVVVELEPRG